MTVAKPSQARAAFSPGKRKVHSSPRPRPRPRPASSFAKWLLDPTCHRVHCSHHTRVQTDLLRQRRFAPAMDRDGRPGWLPSLGFAFLSFNCGMAVYRSWDDPSSVAFVVVAYVALILLFRCLHLLEGAAPGRQGRPLKAAVWGLSTLLTLMFSSKVAAIMPLWAQLLVWAMGIFTIVAGFYAFFLARPEQP